MHVHSPHTPLHKRRGQGLGNVVEFQHVDDTVGRTEWGPLYPERKVGLYGKERVKG